MRVRVSTFALAITLGSIANASAQQPSNAYDFRGARLGMTVAEFRGLKYPDESAYVQGRIVCSGDPEITSDNTIRVFGELFLAPLERNLGLIKCGFFQSSTHTYPGTNRSFTTWMPARVIAGSYPGQFTYSFAPKASGEPATLYEIQSTDIRKDGFSPLIEGLKQRFGPPISDVSDTMQVRSGAVFPRRSLEWSNGQDTISVVAPGLTSDTMTLAYRNSEHAGSIREAIKRAIGTPDSRL